MFAAATQVTARSREEGDTQRAEDGKGMFFYFPRSAHTHTVQALELSQAYLASRRPVDSLTFGAVGLYPPCLELQAVFALSRLALSTVGSRLNLPVRAADRCRGRV